MRNILIILGRLLALLVLLPSFAAAGPVGFQRIEVPDPTKSAGGQALEAALWYPALAGTGEPMRLDDYITDQDHFFHVLEGFGYDAADVDRQDLLSSKVAARHLATPISAAAPLVIYARAADETNHLLAERLAERGFAVASIPADLGGLPSRGGTDLPRVRQIARDIDLLLGGLDHLRWIDDDRKAIVAFSSPALAALLVGASRDDVDAIVSIEGWDAFTAGTRMLRRPGVLDERSLRAPLLHVSGGVEGREQQIDRTLFQQLSFAPRAWAELEALDHGGFLTYAAVSGQLTPIQKRSVDAAIELIGAFLETHLENESQSWIETATAVSDVIEIQTFAAPAAKAPTSDELWRMLWSGGASVDAVSAALAGAPQLLTEEELNRMASILASRGRLDDALRTGELQVDLHPGSYAAWHTLGDLHRLAGAPEDALVAYRRSLEIQPYNRAAANAYRQLADESDRFAAALPRFDHDVHVVLRHPVATDVTVRPDLPFAERADGTLRFDLYSPPSAEPHEALPVVLFATSIPSREMRHWGMYTSWLRLVAAALGVRAISHDVSTTPRQDLDDLLSHLQEEASELGLDTSRVAVWSASANVRGVLPWLMDGPPGVVAASLYYGVMEAPYLRDDLPLQIVRAGRDMDAINATIDAFVERALAAEADFELLNVAEAGHAFDFFEPEEYSRAAIRQTLDFFQEHLHRGDAVARDGVPNAAGTAGDRAAAMLEALGGRDRWRELETLFIDAEHEEPQLEMPYDSAIWRQIGVPRFVIVQRTDELHSIRIVDGNAAWSIRNGVPLPMSADTERFLRHWDDHLFYAVVRDLARGELTAAIDERGRLSVSRGGRFVAAFELDDRNLPVRYAIPTADGTGETVTDYTRWGSTDGFVHPLASEPEGTGAVFTARSWVPNAAVSELERTAGPTSSRPPAGSG